MSWNLTVEHQLRNDVLVRGGYVGIQRHAPRVSIRMSTPPRYFPGAAATSTPICAALTSDFTQVTQNVSGANSIYNSLQVGVEKRFSHGFTLGANYTFGRSLDWASYLTDLDGINVINPFNLRAYRGVSDFNVPHRFVLNYVWQLPSPSGRRSDADPGGWETTGIWNWQSGFPLDIVSGEDTR